MTRAGDFNLTITAGAPTDDRGVVPRDGAIAKEAVRDFKQGIELKTDSSKTAKRGVQVSHQERGRHSLPHYITEKKEKFAISRGGRNQVAVVTAHDSRRSVLIVTAPVAETDIGLRK